MNDIELLDKLFRYIYDNGEIMYYDRAMRECDFDKNLINEKGVYKFHRLLLSSGFFQKNNKISGNNPFAVKMSDEGYYMISQYGSYKNYLNSIEEEKKKVEQKKELEIKKVALDENSKKEENKNDIKIQYWQLAIGVLAIIVAIIIYFLSKR